MIKTREERSTGLDHLLCVLGARAHLGGHLREFVAEFVAVYSKISLLAGKYPYRKGRRRRREPAG